MPEENTVDFAVLCEELSARIAELETRVHSRVIKNMCQKGNLLPCKMFPGVRQGGKHNASRVGTNEGSNWERNNGMAEYWNSGRSRYSFHRQYDSDGAETDILCGRKAI